MCHGVCGVNVHMDGERVTKITGDRDHPMSKGYICSKGRASVDLLYHPDRLQYPMRRKGPKGANQWERISWDEALDEIATKLLAYKREHGPQSVAVATGTGRPYMFMTLRFVNAFGTPNFVGYAHACYLPRVMASAVTARLPIPVCDFYGVGGVKPACVLVWGCNISETGSADGLAGCFVHHARRDGAKLIVVDPRRTQLAKKSDVWVQVRPGTDVALALAMLNVIIEEDLYDHDFVEGYTVGFDELRARAAEFSPARAAEITWVPEQTIREMARLYATTKPACLLWGNGLDQSPNCFQTARALMILRAVTGNLDVPGGDAFWVPPEGVYQTSPFLALENTLPEMVAPEVAVSKLGFGDTFVMNPGVRHSTFYRAVLEEKPYPVKALILMGTNPLLTASDPLAGEEALRKLEFTVAIDMFMTPTAQFADIVLPAASWLEQDDVADLHFIWCVAARQKVAQIGECRDDKQIIFDLARRLGLEDCFPWKDVREWCDYVLAGAGMDFEEFCRVGLLGGEMRYRKHETDGFATPSGKFEIACSSLEGEGFEAVPDYIEPPESPFSSPEVAEEYPLIAITGAKIEPFFHTEFRQIESQRRKNPDPIVEIHPEVAGELSIEDGDWVWVESPRGRIRQRARLTPDIDPRVVSIQHAWWFPEREAPEYGWKESCASLLLDPRQADPIWGAEAWKGFLCRVYP